MSYGSSNSDTHPPKSLAEKPRSSVWRQSITYSALVKSSNASSTNTTPTPTLPPTAAERRRRRLASDPINAHFARPPPVFSRPGGSRDEEGRPMQSRRKSVVMPERREEVLRRRRVASMGAAVEGRMSLEDRHRIVLDQVSAAQDKATQSFIIVGTQEDGENLPAIPMDMASAQVQQDPLTQDGGEFKGGDPTMSQQPLERVPAYQIDLTRDDVPLTQSQSRKKPLKGLLRLNIQERSPPSPSTPGVPFPSAKMLSSSTLPEEIPNIPVRYDSLFQRAMTMRRRMVSTASNVPSLKHKHSLPSLREASRDSVVEARTGLPLPQTPHSPQTLRKRFSLSNLSQAFKRKSSKPDLSTEFTHASPNIPAVPVIPAQYRSVTDPVPRRRSSSESTMSPARTSSGIGANEEVDEMSSKASHADHSVPLMDKMNRSMLSSGDAQEGHPHSRTSSTCSSVSGGEEEAQIVHISYRQDSVTSPQTPSALVALRFASTSQFSPVLGTPRSWKSAMSSTSISTPMSSETLFGTSDEDGRSSTCSYMPATPDAIQDLPLFEKLPAEDQSSSANSTPRLHRGRRGTQSADDDAIPESPVVIEYLPPSENISCAEKWKKSELPRLCWSILPKLTSTCRPFLRGQLSRLCNFMTLAMNDDCTIYIIKSWHHKPAHSKRELRSPRR